MKAIYTTFDYHKHNELNPLLYNTICQNLSDQPLMGGGIITPYWNLHKRGLQDVDTLCEWIQNITHKAAFVFSQGGEDKVTECDNHLGFKTDSFTIAECWGVHYTPNTKVIKHNHFPFAMSFVYCVQAPKGCSPLIIEDDKIESVEGRIVFFLSHQYHNSIETNTTGRCMIAGNLIYKWE